MSRQKGKGTRFETANARYLTAALGVPVERRALHGSGDLGDLFGLVAHGKTGIAECKDHKNPCHADVERWRRETVDERDNADADFAVLIIHCDSFGKCGATETSPTFGRNRVDVQLRDLAAATLGLSGEMRPEDAERWVSMELGTFIQLCGGEAPNG